ncbi:MAG: SAM-dependent methyltransferase [Burkholderiales bacterium]
MKLDRFAGGPRRGGLRFLALLLAVCAHTPVAAQDYGDTPYVPTPQNVVDKMLEVAKVGPKDYVIDLGSGDGRMVITAAKKYGARGFGVDLDKQLVSKANALAARAGVADRARFYARDLYETDVSPATVLTIYLLPEVNLMVRPRLLATLKPGTRIVSHDYDMGEWPPDLALTIEAPGKTVGRDRRSKVFFWVMPATASGKWRWQLPLEGKTVAFEMALDQMFQRVEGTLTVDGRQVAIEDGRLDGVRIAFAAALDDVAGAPRYRFTGRVSGDAIEGEARAGAAPALAWKAVRIQAWKPAHVFLPPPPPPGE